MKIYVIGIGMGNKDTMTLQARSAIAKAEVVVGAERMVKHYKNYYAAYKPEDIKDYIDSCGYETVAVLFSGDIGFYSGAKKLLKVLEGYDTQLISGVSSYTYFCNRLGLSTEDVKPFSIHGRQLNYIYYINTNKYCFFLMGGYKDLEEMCGKLLYYGMNNVVLHIGEKLSYADEKITHIKPDELEPTDNLIVVITENKDFKSKYTGLIEDTEFIRGNVPMTKSVVRTVSVGKLELTEDASIYDIGAGTGSVSVEMALFKPDSRIYAVEKNKEALELIKQNRKKFAVDNVKIIEGNAPDVLALLPPPKHVFVGGSNGNMKEILDTVWSKNNEACVVVNAVSLNTVSQLTEYAQKNSVCMETVQIAVSNGDKVGSHILMKSENPVYVFKMRKEITKEVQQ